MYERLQFYNHQDIMYIYYECNCVFITLYHTVNEENSEVELLVSYNRRPFNIAKIPFEDSHQVCDSHVTCTYVCVS